MRVSVDLKLKLRIQFQVAYFAAFYLSNQAESIRGPLRKVVVYMLLYVVV
jgi:hypothetical protein